MQKRMGTASLGPDLWKACHFLPFLRGHMSLQVGLAVRAWDAARTVPTLPPSYRHVSSISVHCFLVERLDLDLEGGSFTHFLDAGLCWVLL